ncbi:MAG: toll/interleukin-1 receptor domain-containing protein [Magnetococcales bacterium]|nr:toll/interleukin-1 receptor domain-containing protein [Magnetococcales bacterium]
MSRIFISYSRQDRKEALGLRAWLREEGWDDVFLDDDPETGIRPGERWKVALDDAGHRCKAVLLLASPRWKESVSCQEELKQAISLGKDIFTLLIDSGMSNDDLPKVVTEEQTVNLVGGRDHRRFLAESNDGSFQDVASFSRTGLKKLKTGLIKAGLDQTFFPWPPDNEPDRSPFRGLSPLEENDAGIFFGRDGPISNFLGKIKKWRLQDDGPRFVVVLGASGSGKSSFLRAGILPRLRRKDRDFIILPVIRPANGVVEDDKGGLLACFAEALKPYNYPRFQIRQDLKSAKYTTLQSKLRQLAQDSSVPSLNLEPTKAPSLVLSIDQGEELFLARGSDETKIFFGLIKQLLIARDPDLFIICTIRSDSYEKLQNAKALEDIQQETFSLPPMPQGSFRTIIEKPLERFNSKGRAATGRSSGPSPPEA